MRRYETIAIIDPDLSEDDRTSLLTRIKDIISEQDGVMINEDLWGTKKLAYEIKKKPRGYYARYDYCGMGPLVDELERSFRIDDRVMKYLTVQLDPDADVEQLQAEIAAAQAAKEAEAAPVQTTPAEDESSAAESSESESPETPVEAEQAPVPETNDSTEKAEEEQS
jgi:small subunit ribosomal protein S6